VLTAVRVDIRHSFHIVFYIVLAGRPTTSRKNDGRSIEWSIELTYRIGHFFGMHIITVQQLPRYIFPPPKSGGCTISGVSDSETKGALDAKDVEHVH
jgi:hypothetical protein